MNREDMKWWWTVAWKLKISLKVGTFLWVVLSIRFSNGTTSRGENCKVLAILIM
jgi:hypothetical protein